jgi:hypothetical protein
MESKMADPIELPGENFVREHTVNTRVKENFLHVLGDVAVAATEDLLEAVLVIAASVMWLVSAAIIVAIFLVPEFGNVIIYNNMTAQQFFVWYGHPGIMALVLTNTLSASFVQNGLGQIDLWATRLGAGVVFLVAIVVIIQVNNGARPPLPGEQLEFLGTIVMFGIVDWVINQHLMKQARNRRRALMTAAVTTTAEARAPATLQQTQAPAQATKQLDVVVHMFARRQDGSKVEIPAT